MTVRDRLGAALADAVKRRDRAQCEILRSALGAIDNAQAVDASDHDLEVDQTSEFAGAISGLGGAEVPRRRLSEDQVADIVRAEIDELAQAASLYAEAGRPDQAAQLQGQADLLREVLES